ncbi:MAG: amidohydrolase family protein [Acidobacteria bacterium]|nr:amidohydrolase family protein [Acidobacteriota bacterium]
MKTIGRILASIFATTSLAFSQGGMAAVLAGRLLDPASGNYLQNAVILVSGDRIERVDPGLTVPPGAAVIDLREFTVLPGLIDTHTHLLLQPEDEVENPVLRKSQAYRTIQGVAAARKNLESGFTTVRDLDSEGAGLADVALRDAIAAGVVPGPRMLVSTYAITITGGHMNNVGLNPEVNFPEPASLVDAPDGHILEIRRQVKAGADWIKVYATGALRHVDRKTLEPLSQFSAEEMGLMVQEARRWRKDVAAHAYGGEGAKNAILGGVRSIEHGMMLDDEAFDLMVQRGTFWCPTLSVYLPAHPPGDEFRQRIVASHRQAFATGLRKGVKIAFGTDVGAFEHGKAAREFGLMVQYGMTPLQAIRSATATAAELLRMEDAIGRIEPGYKADMVAVRGDPLRDVRLLQNVEFVMKDGQVYRSPK